MPYVVPNINPVRSGWPVEKIILVFLLALATLLVISPLSTYSQEVINREYLIKAAYVLNFARYVEWPEPSGQSSGPFVIGIFQPDPISSHLRQADKIEGLNRDLKIVVLDPQKDIPACHILYFPRALPAPVQQELLKKASQKGTLLVGETQGFLEWGGTINFVISDNKVRLEIHVSQAQAQGLRISSKLIQLARMVR